MKYNKLINLQFQYILIGAHAFCLAFASEEKSWFSAAPIMKKLLRMAGPESKHSQISFRVAFNGRTVASGILQQLRFVKMPLSTMRNT